jgi:hypothetical protein
MAVNNSRSMNGELAEGMSDCKYKKVDTADRGGVVDAATYLNRAALDDLYYGIHEASTKVLPDGTVHTTPDYVPTPAPDMMRW